MNFVQAGTALGQKGTTPSGLDEMQEYGGGEGNGYHVSQRPYQKCIMTNTVQFSNPENGSRCRPSEHFQEHARFV